MKTFPVTTNITKGQIDRIFEEAKHQSDYVIGLYRLAHADFDQIEKFDSAPRASEMLNDYVFKKAIPFDSKHHPTTMAGGAWMNFGFGTDTNLEGFTVRTAPSFSYKDGTVIDEEKGKVTYGPQ